MKARTNAILPFTPEENQVGKNGHFVTLTGTPTATLVTDAADVPFGVLTEGFNPGGAAKSSVAVSAGGYAGTVYVKLSGAVNAGDDLELTADGSVVADSGAGSRVIVAQACEDGADEELIEAVIFKPIELT